jgi:hypothetical protein
MGGKSSNTQSTVTQQNIPEEFYPYFERLLIRGEEETLQPYTPFEGQRLAGQTPDTEASYGIVRDVATRDMPGRDLATDVAARNIGMTGQLIGANQPYQFSPFGGFNAGQAAPYAGFSATGATPFAGFEGYEADPYARFQQAQFQEFGFDPTQVMDAGTAASYMDPFMRNVLDVQKEQAREDFQISQAARDAAAVRAGAFGGSRQQVAEGMAERDLMTRLRDIEATGLQSAYADATRRFEADRGARFAADQARAAEAARVQAGLAGEAGRVQGAEAAELARVQSMSANEFARLQQSQAAELARVQGISIEEAARIQQSQASELARVQGISIEEAARVQAARAGEIARVQAAQAAENQNYIQQQMALMGFSADQAGMVAKLEEAARSGDIQAAQLLESIGKAQQTQTQAGLDLAYEDFLRQQGWNKEQLGFLSAVLQGLPVANAGETTALVPYNPIQQALGAGLAGLSLYQGFR